MPDIFSSYQKSLISPAERLEPVTKHDTNELTAGTCKALLVGTAGTANLVDAYGSTRTNVPLKEGYNPIRVKIIKTGGTADDIWALY